MNKRDKYEKEKIKKRKEKEEEKEKEKEKKREAYLREKEEEIRNRKVNIDYKKKKEKKKEEEEEEEQEEENDNEYEEIEEEEEEKPNKRKEKNRSTEKGKYDKHIEKNYLGHKGITKRTIGVGRLNVKVYENDEDDSWLNDVVKKEKKEKREYKKTEITQNKNIEDKYVKNNEIKNNNYNHNYNHNYSNNDNNHNINHNINNNINNNSEGKNSKIFNIDGRNFLIKASYLYSNNSEDGEIINVKFSTTSPGSKIVHWGLYKSISPKIWILPPKSSYPNFTKEVNNKALETKFPNSQVNGQREISFVLPRKMDGGYIGGIYFAIYDPIKNLWYNNFKKNFNLVFN